MVFHGMRRNAERYLARPLTLYLGTAER